MDDNEKFIGMQSSKLISSKPLVKNKFTA